MSTTNLRYQRHQAVDICPRCGNRAEIVFTRVDCSNEKCRFYSARVVSKKLQVGDKVKFVEASSSNYLGVSNNPTRLSDWAGWDEFYDRRRASSGRMLYRLGYYTPGYDAVGAPPTIAEIAEEKWIRFNEWAGTFWCPISAVEKIN